MRALIKTVDDAICTNDRQLANMNIGGVLAGGGGLSCKLQTEVGALDLYFFTARKEALLALGLPGAVYCTAS